MGGEKRMILQKVQDQLADLSNLSMVLLNAKRAKVLVLSRVSMTQSQFKNVCVTDWSNPEEYLRIIFSEDKILGEYIDYLRPQIEAIDEKAKAGKWEPQIFRGPLGLYHFIAPITELSGQREKIRQRRIIYYLFGGSVWFSNKEEFSPDDAQRYLRELKTKGKLQLPCSLEYQILGEVLNAPTWRSQGVLFYEVETLRLTMNGIIRTYLADVTLPEDVLYPVVELYHSISRRDRFRNGLDSVLEIVPFAKAAFVVIKQIRSKTGFLAMRVPTHSRAEFRDQWLFIPRSEDIEGFLRAKKFEDAPERERKYLDFDFSIRFESKLNIFSKEDGELIGSLWILGDKRPRRFRKGLPKDKLKELKGFLTSCRNYLVPDKERISHTIFKAQQGDVLRRRTQLARLIHKPTFWGGEPLRHILKDAQ